MFRVSYISWRMKYEECVIFANDIFEACEIAEHLQGVERVIEVVRLVL